MPTAACAPWQPLPLAPAEAEAAEGALRGIAEALGREAALEGQAAGLSQGLSGIALFFGHLAAARPGEGWEDRAFELAGRAVDALAVRPLGAGLYGGFAGVAWTLDHLQGLLAGDGEDLNRSVDAALLDFLDRGPRPFAYDLVQGLVGVGVYAAGRAGRGQGPELLARVVARLAEASEPTPEGRTWHTPQALVHPWRQAEEPLGHYDLGPAHGVAGVVGLLGLAWAQGVRTARPLLEEAVAWLLDQRLAPGAAPRFPKMVHPGRGPEPSKSPVSWCYGDLGTSLLLLGAARRAGRGDWESEALAMARVAAALPLDTDAVRDAGLCHGAFGTSHLFRRLHQATGEACFLEAALRWHRTGMDFHDPALGVGGFRYWIPALDREDQGWTDRPGFLEGSAGIGLALLAALEARDPAWDRLMLLDLP